jgi:D-alanine-D-alanine ligase
MNTYLNTESIMKNPKVMVLTGGVGPEREVSLTTGKALAKSLEKIYSVHLEDLCSEKLPMDINNEETIVFPAIHGTFGEDGRLQKLLEERGIFYSGSGPDASRLCMNKFESKKVVATAGVRVAPDFEFSDPSEVNSEEILSQLGQDLVIKPVDQGSSVALYVIHGSDQFENVLGTLSPGNWMVEKRIFGREVTVGILGDCSLGIVEVIPKGGVYDFERKYTAGSTEYRFPAVLDCDIESEVKISALKAFHACGCRDFSRVDFIICEDGNAYFLEINTLPGLTETSLLPKSASCAGYDFDKLAMQLLHPAVSRFTENALVSV